MSDTSLAMQGAAIYLHEKKGMNKHAICNKLNCSVEELAGWLLNRQSIKHDLSVQLSKHYMSTLMV